MIARAFTDKLKPSQLEAYYEKLVKLLDDAKKDNSLRSLAFSPNVNIFERLLDRQVFGWPPVIPPNIVYVIVSQ